MTQTVSKPGTLEPQVKELEHLITVQTVSKSSTFEPIQIFINTVDYR